MSRSIGFSHRMALCGLGGGGDQLDMGVGRGGDQDGVDAAVGQHLARPIPPPGSHAPRPPPPPPAAARRTPRPARPWRAPPDCRHASARCARSPEPRIGSCLPPPYRRRDEPSAGVLSNGGGDVTRQAPRQTSPAPTNDHGADGDVSLREPLARGRKSGPCVGAIRPLIRFVSILLVERATIYPGALGATGCIY